MRDVTDSGKLGEALGLSLAELADFGLDAGELRRLTAMTLDQFERRRGMARLAGLDPRRLAGEPALDVATALGCADCAAEGPCRASVEREDAAAAMAFCGNLVTFGALAAEAR